MKEVWNTRIEPGRILGNLYFVGTHPASSHLIDTGDGLILIDTGYPDTLYLVVQSIWELGFRPENIRYILHSHGHFDHCGATAPLQKLTGAKTLIGAGDEDYVNGKLDLTWAKELGYRYEYPFEADIVLHDGDHVRLGNTDILCISTPGHTPGTLSFFFDIEDGGTVYRAGMQGGGGVNSMARDFLLRYGLSFDCRQDFLNGIARLRKEHVDVTLGNHVWNNDTNGKLARVKAGERTAFVDPAFWQKNLDGLEKALADMLAAEAQAELNQEGML